MNLLHSRRHFLALTVTALPALARAATPGQGLTARQIIERIQKQVGVEWRKDTVDTFKIGNPDAPVKGIATSFSATLDVCQRAHAAGLNLIIVHEPTFYNHTDETKDLSGEVYETKRNFIEKNGLVVWRFHDHWHARRPDGVFTGMTTALGWEKYRSPDSRRQFTLPATTLTKLAQQMQTSLKAGALRVIGDRAAHRAGRAGQHEAQHDALRLDHEALDQAEVDDVLADLGVEHGRQRLQRPVAVGKGRVHRTMVVARGHREIDATQASEGASPGLAQALTVVKPRLGAQVTNK